MHIYLWYWLISLSASIIVKNRLLILLFYASVFFFVGFRFETGFDWPVYKSVFEVFSNSFSLYTIEAVQLSHSQETGFLIFMGILSKVMPNYELAQAFFTFLFILSFLKLSDSIPNSRPAFALSIYFSILLLPMGFSTVRQAFAISIFNIFLAIFLRKKYSLYLIFPLLSLSAFFHTTSVFYILAFYLAYFISKNRIKINIKYFAIISMFLSLSLPIAFRFVVENFPAVGGRVFHYEDLTIFADITLFSIVFALFLLCIGLFVLIDDKNYRVDNIEINTFKNLIIILSSIAFSSIFFLTLRDRIAYELLILFSIYITRNINIKNFIAALTCVIFGIYYQISILRPPQDLAFIPYQNYIVFLFTGEESSGKERSSLYMDEFIRRSRQ